MPSILIHYPADLPTATLTDALQILGVTPRLTKAGELIARTPDDWFAQDHGHLTWTRRIPIDNPAARIRAASSHTIENP